MQSCYDICFYVFRKVNSLIKEVGFRIITSAGFRNKSTMSEWVAVCADENEEPVEIPTESDGKYFNIIFL